MRQVREDPLLDLESRRRVYQLVRAEPGIYLREMQRALSMPMGNLEWHLSRLEKAGLVAVRNEENKRFFPAEMGAADRRFTALLRQRPVRRITCHLLEAADSPHKAIATATGLPPSTLSFYLAKMVEAGLCDRRRRGRENLYALKEAGRVEHLLLAYAPSVFDRVLDGFLDSFEDVRLS